MDKILIAKAKRVAQGEEYEEWCGNGNEELEVELGDAAPSLLIAKRLSSVIGEELDRIGGTVEVGAGYIDYGKGYARVVDRFRLSGNEEPWMISVFYCGDKALG